MLVSSYNLKKFNIKKQVFCLKIPVLSVSAAMKEMS